MLSSSGLELDVAIFTVPTFRCDFRRQRTDRRPDAVKDTPETNASDNMSKCTIVGCGAVGEAIANALVRARRARRASRFSRARARARAVPRRPILTFPLCANRPPAQVLADVVSDLVLYDVVKDKLKGMAMDFQHGQGFHVTRVTAGDWPDTAGSDVVIITAGVRQREGESRRDLMGRNKAIMEHIVPPMAKHSPNAIVIVVANPCDFMTQLVQQMSGFPPGRVFGSGTFLDSSRLRTELSKKIGVAPESINAYILGEHGDASVVAVHTATVGCTLLTELVPLAEIDVAHKAVIAAAAEVIKLRGYTATAIGMAVGKIVQAIVRDKRVIIPVSCPAKGRCGVEADVYMSLPCIVDKHGARPWSTLLRPDECDKLKATAQIMFDASKEILNL